MTRIVVTVVAVLFAAPLLAQTRPATPADVALVQKVIAHQLSVPLAEVKPETTLDSLAADELDFVEILMELEDEAKIVIPDDVFDDGKPPAQRSMPKGITAARLAEIVGASRAKATSQPAKR